MKYSESIFISQNKRGWMNSILMNSWIKRVLLPYCRKNNLNNFHLVLDSAPCHKKDFDVNQNMLKNEALFIPDGATYLLQPIDISIGKPFKDEVRKYFSDWFDDHYKEGTKNDNIKNPLHTDIVSWVEATIANFDAEIIRRSFELGCFTIDIKNKEEIKKVNQKLLNKENILQVIEQNFNSAEKYDNIDDMMGLIENSEDHLELIDDDNSKESYSDASDYSGSETERLDEEFVTDDEEDEEFCDLNKLTDRLKVIDKTGQISIKSYFKK